MPNTMRNTVLIALIFSLVGCAGTTGGNSSSPAPSSSSSNNSASTSQKSEEQTAADNWSVPSGFRKINTYVAVRPLGPGEASCTASSLCWVFEVTSPINCRIKLDAVEKDSSGRIVNESFQTALVSPRSFGIIEFSPSASDVVALDVVKGRCFR